MLRATLSRLRCQDRSTGCAAGQKHLCQQEHAEQMLTTKEAAGGRNWQTKAEGDVSGGAEHGLAVANPSAAPSGTRQEPQSTDNPARLPPYKLFHFYFSIASVCRAAAHKLASKIKYFTVPAAATSHLVLWAARGRLGNAFCRALTCELRESLSSLLPFQSIT